MTSVAGRLVVIAMSMLLSALASGQARPDFSGRWTTAAEPADAGGGDRGAAAGGRRGAAGGRGARTGDMGSGWGDVITIAQDAKQLTVEWAFFARGDLQPPLRFTYALDGTPTTNAVSMGRGTQEQGSRARWNGDALVIASSYTFANPATGKPITGTLTRTLSLTSPTTLVIEVTRDGVLGGPASTTRTTYRKLG